MIGSVVLLVLLVLIESVKRPVEKAAKKVRLANQPPTKRPKWWMLSTKLGKTAINKLHPNCICYTTDELRNPKEWRMSPPLSIIKDAPASFRGDDAKGTNRFIKKQYQFFNVLMDGVIADATPDPDEHSQL